MSSMGYFLIDLQTSYNCQTLCVVGRFCFCRECFHKYEYGNMQSPSQWVVCLDEEEDILAPAKTITNIHLCTLADMANTCLLVLSSSLSNDLCVSSIDV